MRDDQTPDSTASLVSEGERLFASEDYGGALRCAEAVIRTEPRSVDALSLRAAAHDALDEVAEASASYDAALKIDPDDVDLVAEAAEFYLARGAEDGNPDWLRRACDLGRRGADLATGDSDEVVTDFILIETDALYEMGLPRNALERLQAAVRARPADVRLAAEQGTLLYELCRFEDARRQFERVVRANPRNPAAIHGLGLLAERAGNQPEASARFARAHELAPELYPAPVHLSHDEFDGAVEAALDELPPQVRQYLSNVAITVEDVPPEQELLAADPPLSPSILGMFRGAPLGEKASMDPWQHFPSSIVLYQANLERFATDHSDLVEQVRVTLLHEVGHFLGLDEEDLRDRGLD